MSACSAALVSGRRVIVSDVERCEFMTGSDDLAILRKTGIRAVQTTPLRSLTGKVVGMISTHWLEPHSPSERELDLLDILARQAADLIERTRVEEMLRVSEEQLRESDRMKDQFLATLAHELRNPLAPIRTSLQLLRLSGNTASSGRLLDIMDRQVDQIVHLVDDLIDISRINRGTIELKCEMLELADVLHAAVDASRPLIERAQHRLEMRFPAGPLPVHGDAVRLTQVFTNLLNNAAKFTDNGGRIEFSVRRDGEHAVISVGDNGIGISPEQLPSLFQMFSQASPGSSRGQAGLGIGLSLAQRLVQMHGGSIEAKSDGLGQGSCFSVMLPLAQHRVSADTSGRPSSNMGLQHLRVLVVDDNRDAGDTLGAYLSFLGADIRVEYAGAAAIAALDEYRPSVVLLDLGMPGTDGYEVARRIRADHRNDAMMLVAITGWDQRQDKGRVRTAGFDYHFTKPVNLEALAALLGSIGDEHSHGIDLRQDWNAPA